MLVRLLERWKVFVCDWFHGGGVVGYDCDGPFWECSKCKRVER